ncbi:hypothetical protein [Anaeromyxobacter oryzisoli]|uniref:hypothetical protein n=1 Tax=Anaeromyxobacter oryzisoli TaxID=2925408 RepID=UPI001F58D670|nr:hypothetical protein [Anaeromyxobacter sp. SG63]
MAAGEPIVSQAETKAFDEGYERVFGERKRVERGRYIYDPELGKCVPAAEYHASRAIDAPVMAGRFYENQVMTDGTVVGSRAQYHEYMERNGLAPSSDFKGVYAQKRAERDRFYTEGYATAADEKRGREAAERALGTIVEMRQRDYDKVRAKREAERARRGKGFEP